MQVSNMVLPYMNDQIGDIALQKKPAEGKK